MNRLESPAPQIEEEELCFEENKRTKVFTCFSVLFFRVLCSMVKKLIRDQFFVENPRIRIANVANSK